MAGKTRVRKKIRRAVAKGRSAVAKGKRLLRKAMKDPLVREYMAKQKKLAKSTLKKAIGRARKRIRV